MTGLPPGKPKQEEEERGGEGEKSEGGGGGLLAVNEMTCAEAARWYWSRGLRPVPWRAVEGRKVAALSGFTYRELVAAPPEEIERLLDRWDIEPSWQVGLGMAGTGDWLVVDVDSYTELSVWEADHGPLQGGTWVQDTGREDGGEHRLYRRGKMLGTWPRQGGFGPEHPHLEVKSNGLVAVAPSTHPSGRRYRWREGCPAEPAEVGWQLAMFLNARSLRPAGSGLGGGGSMAGGGEPVDIGAWLREGLPAGRHDDGLTRLALKLVNRGYADLECLDVMRRAIAATALTGATGWSDENLLRKVASARELVAANRPGEVEVEWARGLRPASEGEEGADGESAESGSGGDESERKSGAPSPGEPFPGPETPMPVAQRLKWEWWDTGTALPTLWHWRGGWLAWTGTHWAEGQAGLMQDWLYHRLEHETWPRVTKSGEVVAAPWNPVRRTVAEVERALEAVRRLPEEVEAGWAWARGAWEPDPGSRVACRNGVVDLLTGELRPHSPAWLNGSSVPFDYDPAATCPRWERFLGQVFPEDAEARALLQEWFGYVLSGRVDLQKMMFLVGASRSGKSTTAGVLTRLVGAGNVAAPALSSFGSNFGLSSLIGKPLAVIDDARYSRSVDMQVVIERLLTITGGGRLDVDRKNRSIWSGRLPTRMMMSSNELPWFRDASGAIVNRLLVLSYEQSFLGREDPSLERELEAELPGILNWALAGLDRLVAVGRFTVPVSSAEVTHELGEQASPVRAFLMECCSFGPEETVLVDDLFREWVVWRGDVKDDRAARTAFGIAMRAAYPHLKKKRTTAEGGAKPYVYIGLSLKVKLPVWAR